MSVYKEFFSPTEAAALAQLQVKLVRKELEHSVLPPASPPRVPFAGLVYLETLRLSGLSLSVADRKRLYRRLDDALTGQTSLDAVPFASVWSLNVGAVVRELTARLERFRIWKRGLVSDPDVMGGETVFPDSRLTVRHVGEMLERGEAPSVILEDYPFLSPQDLEFAPIFVKAYPRVGRPSRHAQAAPG